MNIRALRRLLKTRSTVTSAALAITAAMVCADIALACGGALLPPRVPFPPAPPPGCPVPGSPGSGSSSGGANAGSGPFWTSDASGVSVPGICDPPPPQCQGSPCYVGSGAYGDSVIDLLIPTAGVPLVVRRLYDSTHAIDGPLGYGWISSISARLYYATYLFSAPSTYRTEADITMPNGARYRFEEIGTTGTFTPPPGRKDVLVKNADGTFDLTLQRSRSVYHFGTDGSLLSMTDDYGNALNVTYDAVTGRVNQIVDASGTGRYLTVTWGPDGRISSIQDSAGRLVQYGYNPQGALRTVTEPANGVTTYSYNPGRVSPLLGEIKDNWNRVISTIVFDSSDRVQSYTEKGETYTYTYNYNGDPAVTAKTDSAGNRWLYPFVRGSLVTDRTPPPGAGGATHTDYDSNGFIELFVDGAGVKTNYTYTTNGSPDRVTRDYQGTEAVRFDYAYDAAFPNKVISITPKTPAGALNPDWQAWQYEYWQAGSPAPGALRFVKRVKSDATLETIATYAYNSRGQIISQTSATGAVTDYGYDTAGNLTTVTGPANNDAGTRPLTTYGPDSLGRVLSVTDPLGKVTSYTYDNLDRVLTVTLPKPSPSSTLDFTTRYSYDNTDPAFPGLLFTYVTDPNAKVTKQGYDQFGQLVKSIEAAGKATTYGYEKGLLKTITDANGNVTTYGYDAGRRLRTATFPDGQIERYDYWDDGLLKTKTDRKSQTITYNYDRHKRLQSKVYPGTAGSIINTYTGQKLMTVTDTSVTPNETHTFSYDTSYRVQTNSQASRGTITYGYNADDTMSSYTVTGGPTTNYAYYPDGSLNTIAWSPVAGQFKYTYSLAGQYNTITFPNGQHRDYAYDDQGRLTQLANIHPTPGNLATYAYGYDHNWVTDTDTMLGQRTSLTAAVPSQGFAGSVSKYYYDGLYQLNRVDYPNVAPLNGEVHSWTYDDIGNRLTHTINATKQTYTYQKIGTNPLNWQRVLNDGVNAYSYDLNGSAVTRNGTPGNFTFGWDYENRMTGITGGATAAYKYDYQRRRTGKTAGTETPTYLYDGLNLVQEAGPSPADYVFGPGIDEPLAMSRGTQIYYPAVDALGSVAALSDSAGTVQNNYVYDAWGQTRTQTGTVLNPFGYTAREFGEAGTLFYRARYYSPTTGRFLSEDPARSDFDRSLYFYGLNRPPSIIDPMGLAAVTPRPTPVEPAGVTCPTCGSNEAPVRDALRGFCAASHSGGCQATLRKYGLEGCVYRQCAGNISVICVQEDCGECGGPCGGATYPGAIYIRPRAFTGQCGSLQDTVAHEIAHLCGIGFDHCNDPKCDENRLRANNVGAACSGKP